MLFLFAFANFLWGDCLPASAVFAVSKNKSPRPLLLLFLLQMELQGLMAIFWIGFPWLDGQNETLQFIFRSECPFP